MMFITPEDCLPLSKFRLISDIFHKCGQSEYTFIGYNNLFGHKHLKVHSVEDELCARLIHDAKSLLSLNYHLERGIFYIFNSNSLSLSLINWGEPERAPHRRVERSQSIYYWGEPERAPHRRVARSQSIYILYMYGTSVTRAPLYTMYSNSRYIPEAA